MAKIRGNSSSGSGGDTGNLITSTLSPSDFTSYTSLRNPDFSANDVTFDDSSKLSSFAWYAQRANFDWARTSIDLSSITSSKVIISVTLEISNNPTLQKGAVILALSPSNDLSTGSPNMAYCLILDRGNGDNELYTGYNATTGVDVGSGSTIKQVTLFFITGNDRTEIGAMTGASFNVTNGDFEAKVEPNSNGVAFDLSSDTLYLHLGGAPGNAADELGTPITFSDIAIITTITKLDL